MSRKPWSKKYSASRSVETVIGPAGASSARCATSTLFAVFTCGRSTTPCGVQALAHALAVALELLGVEEQRRGVDVVASIAEL